MAISTRTRKILWVKAAGRCSICRVQLVTEGSEMDDPSVFGEEAHIVARAPDGPRAGQVEDHDAYDNLILLCNRHHKQIDDQVSTFPIERLHQIKRDHEHWAANIQTEANGPFGPVRLVPDPTKRVSRTFRVFFSGREFWNFFNSAHSFRPSYPMTVSDEDEDLIVEFINDLRDWMDLAGGVDDLRVGRDAARSLGEHIESLSKAGYLVSARERYLLLAGGADESTTSWRMVDVEIAGIDDAELVDADGNPLPQG